MPQVTQTFKIKYRKNTGLVMSPAELLEQYFYGTPIKEQDGREMSENTIRLYIDAAQKEIEKFLNLKLKPQIIEEEKDFYWLDFRQWGFMRMTYMVRFPLDLIGFISDQEQIRYPREWLSFRKTSDGELYHRNLYLVPGNNNVRTNAIVFSGVTPHLGFLGRHEIPNYWRVTYCTGFDKVPSDLVNFIGKLAAINIFHILGDLIIGAGIASQSIGIDGLSQSIATTSSATNAGYGARIIGYTNDLKLSLPKLDSYYKGPSMTVV